MIGLAVVVVGGGVVVVSVSDELASAPVSAVADSMSSLDFTLIQPFK